MLFPRFENENEDTAKPGKREDRLLKARTIMIFGVINQKVSQDVTEKLLLLANESNDPIKIFINSQGGHVEAADTIFDMIQFSPAPVKVIGTGWVASAAAFIFVAPPKENRLCLPNTRFMIHQPLGGVSGSAGDLAIEAQEIMKMRDRLNQIFANQTGQSLEQVAKDSDRNFWMSAEEAKTYGIVGKVIQSLTEI